MKRKPTDVDEDDDVPLTKAELAKLKPVAFVKKLRQKLELSQTEFASRYGIPVGTLRDWEQHKSKPDKAAEILLLVIATAPEAVERAAAKKKKVA